MPDHLKINDLYYGKLKTKEEVKELKASVIRRYKHSQKKNLGAIHRDLLKEGYEISYDTLRTWVRRSGVQMIRPSEYVPSEQLKTATTVYWTQELHSVTDGFTSHLTKSELSEFAVRMATGMKTDNMMCLFFDKGNVILTEKDQTVIAMFTADLSPSDIKLLSGMVNMAEEQPDWIKFVQSWCHKSGINHYP